MLLGAILSFASSVGGASSTPNAVDAFLSVCASSSTMKMMESAAKSRGWINQTYPEDIRAGFLAVWRRQSDGGLSASYAEVYAHQVAEGPAYIIISRTEPLFGSKLPITYQCELRVFGYTGKAPSIAISSALGVQPIEPWNDEQGNEVLNWYASKRLPGGRFQMSRAFKHTSVAGPAELSGLAISVDYSGDDK